jgi:hypothetical protein
MVALFTSSSQVKTSYLDLYIEVFFFTPCFMKHRSANSSFTTAALYATTLATDTTLMAGAENGVGKQGNKETR